MFTGTFLLATLALHGTPFDRPVGQQRSRHRPAACSPSEDAIAAQLQRLQLQRPGVRAAPRRPAAVSAGGPSSSPAAARALPGTESAEVPVWEVPERLRMPGVARVDSHGRHHSLEDLFPGTGIADAWDTNPALRTALRLALRTDLFAPFLPASWDARRIACATGLGAACMVSWRAAADCECAAFASAFAEHGVRLSGSEFLLGLGGLCGPAAAGSLIDIVPLGRRVVHSWHQDSGLPGRSTVLLGFPPCDCYTGGGVFSSSVKLSHRLRPTSGSEHGGVLEYERYEPPEPPPGEPHVLRPLYGRGREVWVYDDTTHLHSTPDRQSRQSLWRFM